MPKMIPTIQHVREFFESASPEVAKIAMGDIREILKKKENKPAPSKGKKPKANGEGKESSESAEAK